MRGCRWRPIACSLAPLLALLVGCGEDAVVVGDKKAAAADVQSDVSCKGPQCAACKDVADGQACDDKNPCTTDDTCVVGECVGKDAGCTCQTDTDCAGQDDDNLCNGQMRCDTSALPYSCKLAEATVVTCEAATACVTAQCEPATGKCLSVNKAAQTPCDDGDVCTTSACDGKGGCAVQAELCDCTTDAQCAKWDDDDICNGSMRCDTSTKPYKCKVSAATVVTCAAPTSACRTVSCQAKTGVCVESEAADGASCDDGDSCTKDDACQGGDCKAVALACPCTSDAACAATDDGDVCNGVPFCNLATGACAINPTTVVTCPTVDDTACRQRVCEPSTGACVWQHAANGTTCDDGDACTESESCAAGACGDGKSVCACKTHADCAAKEDGDLCNGTLYCDPTSHVCKIKPTTVVACPTTGDNACQFTSCDPKTGTCAVQLAAEGTACDDGEACTEGDACEKGVCKAGPNLKCPCLADKDCGKFEDGDLCNGTLYCDKSGKDGLSSCVVNLASVVTCTTALDTACVAHRCQPKSGTCAKELAPEDKACSDGDPCTGPDGCQGGVCKGGPLSCDDSDGCTIDACSAAAGGCTHQAKACSDDKPCTLDGCKGGVCTFETIAGGCDDGDGCTQADQCVGGECKGAPLTCDDDKACTQDSCKAGVGCVHLAVDATACDDGDACTDGDSCKKGVCAGKKRPASACADKSPCTIDSCHPAVGCLHVAIDTLPCNDGDQCTKNDSCKGGVCAGVALDVKVCGDDNPCTADSCDALLGCVHKPVAAACDDGDPCTLKESCKGGICVAGTTLACSCKTDSDCDAKEDGDLCNGVLFCDKGQLPWACHVKPSSVVVCEGANSPCVASTCNPKTGVCTNKPIAEGGDCQPGKDKCAGGVCKSGICFSTGKTLGCDDGKACTVDVCAPAVGCTHVSGALDGKSCDDGDSCTGKDRCKGSACVGVKAGVCDDGNACTVDLCDPAKGCAHKAGLLDGKLCDDGDLCSAGDRCVGDACKAKGSKDCDDKESCTMDVCQAKTGCAHLTAPLAGQPCADATVCTKDEVCSGGKCVGKQVDCDDGNPCTADQCLTDAGCSHTAPSQEGKSCVHASGCVKGSVCKAGLCSGGDNSGCGNIGDCAVQPDSLFTVTGRVADANGAQAVGAVGFVFRKGDGGAALLESTDGVLRGLDAAHPLAKVWTQGLTAATWALSLAATTALSPRPVGVETSDGGLIIGGGSRSGGGQWSSWLRRLDANGGALWLNKPGVVAAPIRDIVALKDGTFASLASETATGQSAFARFTAAGLVVWQRSDRGSSSNTTLDRWSLRRLAAHVDGGVVAAGSLMQPAGAAGVAAHALAVRLSANGKSKIFVAAISGGWSARWHDVLVLADGSVRLVGERQLSAGGARRPWYARLSVAGKVLEKREVLTAPGERVLDAVHQAVDGSLVVASHARAAAGKGFWRAELQRLAGEGKAGWGQSYVAAGAHQQPCPGCLSAAAGDGWRLGVQRFATSVAAATPVLIRAGPWGHASCKDAGKCGSKTLSGCSDGVACTLDRCAAAQGCQHVARDEVCDDGNVCTGNSCVADKGCVASPLPKGCVLLGSCEISTCSSGVCKSTGKLLDCSDGNSCTEDVCSTVNGCVNTPLTTGSLCRNLSACKEGTCSGGKVCSDVRPLDCYDEDACTADACTPGKGCTHTPMINVACNDGDACTSGEACANGSCTGGQVKACGSGKACTAGTCHAATCGNRKGLTFTSVVQPHANGEPRVQRFVAYAKAYGFPWQGNPYTGDGDCNKKLPVLCFRKWNYAYPSPVGSWSKGEIRATVPVLGCGIKSDAIAKKLCTDAFGAGWTWHSWHTTGQETYAWGRVPRGTRSWSHIGDQAQGTCW